MFRDIWTIAKKDLKACLRDKVILIQILILPFAIVFGYGMLMSAMNSSGGGGGGEKDVKSYYVSAPDYLAKGFNELGYKSADKKDIEKIKEEIGDKKSNLLVVFPSNFSVAVPGSEKLDDIEIWYNSEKKDSITEYNIAKEVLNTLQPKVFTVNSNNEESYDLGDPLGMLKSMLGMIMPIMMLMAVFMVSMNLAANAIAGDREKGFLNTMLITPVKRSSIASGKALYIFITAIVGGLSGFVGMAVSLPNIAKTMEISETLTYSINEYLLLFGVTLTAVFVLAGELLIVSTLASDVKQATTISPLFLMILMVAGMLTMADGFKEVVDSIGIWNYFIPVWNTMRIMQEIIMMKYSGLHAVITCGVNVVTVILMILILGKLFEREKILKD